MILNDTAVTSRKQPLLPTSNALWLHASCLPPHFPLLLRSNQAHPAGHHHLSSSRAGCDCSPRTSNAYSMRKARGVPLHTASANVSCMGKTASNLHMLREYTQTHRTDKCRSWSANTISATIKSTFNLMYMVLCRELLPL